MADHDRALAPLDPIVGSCLARLPEDRWESVDAFGAALATVARDLDLLASHLEVGVLVERVAKRELEDQRRASSRVIAPSFVGEITPILQRDVETATLDRKKTRHPPRAAARAFASCPLPLPLIIPPQVPGFREEARPARNLERLGLAGACAVSYVLALAGLGLRMKNDPPPEPIVIAPVASAVTPEPEPEPEPAPVPEAPSAVAPVLVPVSAADVSADAGARRSRGPRIGEPFQLRPPPGCRARRRPIPTATERITCSCRHGRGSRSSHSRRPGRLSGSARRVAAIERARDRPSACRRRSSCRRRRTRLRRRSARVSPPPSPLP